MQESIKADSLRSIYVRAEQLTEKVAIANGKLPSAAKAVEQQTIYGTAEAVPFV